MFLTQVTLTAAATKIIPSNVTPAPQNGQQYQKIIIQNNATHVIRVGDQTVSATKGISVAVAGTLDISGLIDYGQDLTDFYIFGTATDVIDVMVLG
jgi:ribosome biogenesis protein Tsr3